MRVEGLLRDVDEAVVAQREQCHAGALRGAIFKLRGVFKLINTEPFAAWFVITGDATADEIRVVWSVLGAISYHQLPSHRALGHAGLLISCVFVPERERGFVCLCVRENMAVCVCV